MNRIATTPDSEPGSDGVSVPPTARDAKNGSATVNRARRLLSRFAYGQVAVSILAIVLGLLAGGVLIIAVNRDVQATIPYFLSRPSDFFASAGNALVSGYSALIRGGIYDFEATGLGASLHPLVGSLNYATPLIVGGLAVAVAFRCGLFNIGGQGQLLMGGTAAGYVSFAVPMPAGVHLALALAAAISAGALWAGIAGAIKAIARANEVVSTIMLNFVALQLVAFLLTTSILRAPGSSNPTSPPALPTAVLPQPFGSGFAINLGFPLAILATIIVSWLLSRSSGGFKLRVVGENASAARVAGISVNRSYFAGMLISGALFGFAGAYQVLGQTTSGFTATFDAGIGFTAITVALLGRSRPFGVLAAGILFGVLQTGGYTLQASEDVSVDLVLIVQAVIVLFIAAPPLVRSIFHLPHGRSRRRPPATYAQGVQP